MSRTFIPLDFESYGITEDELREIAQMSEDGSTTLMEEHICCVNSDLLDCVVFTCNKFKEIGATLINTDFFNRALDK
jgi:hypothetical protein